MLGTQKMVADVDVRGLRHPRLGTGRRSRSERHGDAQTGYERGEDAQAEATRCGEHVITGTGA